MIGFGYTPTPIAPPTGSHAAGTVEKCSSCQEMREVPGWTVDPEPFGQDAPPEREYLR